MFRELARRLVPEPIRAEVAARRRGREFRLGIREFLRLGPRDRAPRALLERIIRGWGNDWSAKWEYLDALLMAVPEAAGPLLECGSGLTTLLVGARCQRLGKDLWALEHNDDWAAKTESILEAHGITAAHVCRADLVDHGEFAWYDPSGLPADATFGLVICDGPPQSTRGGRVGLLPVMAARLAPGCRVFLDDAGRPEEQRIIASWAERFGTVGETKGAEKSFAEIVAAHPRNGPRATDLRAMK